LDALVKMYSRLGAAIVTLVTGVLGAVSGVSLQALLFRCLFVFLICFVGFGFLGSILGRMILKRLLEERGARREWGH